MHSLTQDVICIRAHKRTRCVVERGIGQLKRRFHVLHGEIRLTPEKASSRVITVCAILHNLCKQRNIPQPEEEEEEEEDDDDDDNGGGDEGGVAVPVQQSGVAYRAHYTNTHLGDADGAGPPRAAGGLAGAGPEERGP
ncbi:hypothetical protein AAFF_G00395220 [Aldrovandia affinis]|uniref:DDE Tnp4 domain-containing protein n=1 Tax=Aldrovandia affinis TaxID=143900 RepID=A0AAD7WL23_9TELE|nr:hypothetical protein AAFF_G00395220 [Aldrovandia affinis]